MWWNKPLPPSTEGHFWAYAVLLFFRDYKQEVPCLRIMVNNEKKKKGRIRLEFYHEKWNKKSWENFQNKIWVIMAAIAQNTFLMGFYDTWLQSSLSTASSAIFANMFKDSINFPQYLPSSFFTRIIFLRSTSHHLCQIFLFPLLICLTPQALHWSALIVHKQL